MHRVVKERCHIFTKHPEFAKSPDFSLYSVPDLIQEAAGSPLPVTYALTFLNQLEITPPVEMESIVRHHSHTPDSSCNPDLPLASASYVGHLVPFPQCLNEIRRLVLGLDGQKVLGSESHFDRWLLVAFGHVNSNIGAIISSYSKQHVDEASSLLDFDSVCSEIQHFLPQTVGKIRASEHRRDLLRYLAFHGNVELLKAMMLRGVNLSMMLVDAAQSGKAEIFDLILDSYPPKDTIEPVIPHIPPVQERLVRDPAFRDHFLDKMVIEFALDEPIVPGHCSRVLTPFVQWLMFSWTYNVLWVDDSVELPRYVPLFVRACIQRFGERVPCSGAEIYWFMQEAMIWHLNSASAATLLQPLHFYHILRLLASSPQLHSGLNGIENSTSDPGSIGDYLVPYRMGFLGTPTTAGYSPLMIALHCGMRPAVQILVDAGATILEYARKGGSPLEMAVENATSEHPRRYRINEGVFATWARDNILVPASTDQDMLQILLEALRHRGQYDGGPLQALVDAHRRQNPMRDIREREDQPEPPKLPGLPSPPERQRSSGRSSRSWTCNVTVELELTSATVVVRLRDDVVHLTSWAMEPILPRINNDLSARARYYVMIWSLWLLSLLKILEPMTKNLAFAIFTWLSRPVVVVPLVACIIMVSSRAGSHSTK
jgi:hypothetical protein